LKFLGRAKKFLQDLATEPPSKVQYFNVRCASGHRVRGERTEGYQALRCPACGEGVFVLPSSPLPEPVAPPRAAEPRPAARFDAVMVEEGPVELTDPARLAVELVDRDPDRADAEIIWDDTMAEVAPRPAAAASSPRGQLPASEEVPAPGRPPAAGPDARQPAVTRPVDSAPARRRPRAAGAGATRADRSLSDPAAAPQVAGPTRREPSRRPAADRPDRDRHRAVPVVLEARRSTPKWTRLSLILLMAPILILATIGWRSWRSQRQEYPLIAERGRLEGIPALDQGNFDRAYQLLSAASRAVDALGGAVEDADEIRHAAEEAALFVNLCSRPLEELLDEAGRTDPETWASRFDTLYKGQAILIDTHIEAAPEPGGSSGFVLSYRVFPPGEATNFLNNAAPPARYAEFDLTGFELFELAPPAVGARVIFGAKLASLRYESQSDRWVVRLEPKSGVFIKHSGALQAIGWPVPKEIDEPEEGPG